MNNNTTGSFPNWIKFCSQTAILAALAITGIVSLSFSCSTAKAQTNSSDISDNEVNSDRVDRVRPIPQRSFYPDRGSQQFFKQGNDNLYFLPESESESILQIDEEVKTEEIEDSEDKSLDE